MNIEYTDMTKPTTYMYERIKEWRQARNDLIKRADELQAEADKIRKNNRAGAAILMVRSRILRTEADRMTAESKRGISGNEIRRSAALARFALAKDKVKK